MRFTETNQFGVSVEPVSIMMAGATVGDPAGGRPIRATAERHPGLLVFAVQLSSMTLLVAWWGG
jgi:hypothetical protein